MPWQYAAPATPLRHSSLSPDLSTHSLSAPHGVPSIFRVPAGPQMLMPPEVLVVPEQQLAAHFVASPQAAPST